EAEAVLRPGGQRQRRVVNEDQLHHVRVALRPLPQGDGARQDRLVHGGQGLPAVAERLDPELRAAQPGGRGRGVEGEAPVAGGAGRGQGGQGQAARVRGRRLAAA